MRRASRKRTPLARAICARSNSRRPSLKPSSESDLGAQYTLGDGTGFLLYPTQFAGKAPNTLMGFESTNVEADVAAMKKKGVKFEEYDMPGLKTVNSIATMGKGKGAWFKDSEGNILSVGTDPTEA